MLVDTLSGPTQASADDAQRSLFDACAVTSRGTLSANTERALRSDLAIYAAWCDELGVRALPASAETIAAFVDAMAKARAPATVRRYVASIAAAHRSVGWEKTGRAEPVRRALARMHRAKGPAPGAGERAHRGVARAPARRHGRRVDGCAQPRATGCRLRHAAAKRGAGCAATVRYRLRNPTAPQRCWWAAPRPTPKAGERRCTLRATAWRWYASGASEAACARAGCSARSNRGALGERLAASQVPRIFKAMAERAGLPGEVVSGISGHSTRVGAAQDMVAGGIAMAAILHAGRWKTTAMVNRYGERLLARP